MAILYGTTGDGTTLPVLVDQFGNLLAKGIKGEPGEPGAPGDPGDPGAPGGDFPLPPDPYEGALLGWLNNGLAWIGSPPIPIPPGVFGPITDWDPAGLLTVEGEIPPQIATGVFVYQCNADGSIYVNGWNNSQNWSTFVSPDGGYNGQSPANAFNGSTAGEGWGAAQNVTATLTIPGGISCSSLRIYSNNDTGDRGPFVINGTQDLSSNVGTTPVWGSPLSVAGGTLNTIQFPVRTGDNAGWTVWAIEVDGAILVDAGEYPTAPNLNFRVQSVNGQNLIGVANRTDNFTIGKYLRIPEQNVARWLYDGNLDKVITSTGIDFLRLTGT